MLRSLLKLIAFIFVTLTIIVLAIDIVHSVSTSNWTTTPLNKILATLLQTDIYSLNQSIHDIISPPLSSICMTLICLPIWSISGALATVLFILSYKKQKPFYNSSYRKEKYV
ncbi:hypothetical protein V4P56_00470 [Bartonella sp. B35(2025)]